MTRDASRPLQCAIIDTLKNTAALCARLGGPGRVFDRAPAAETSPLPRLVYGGGGTRAWHSATFDGQEHEISLDLYSGPGQAPVRDLSAAVIERLHDADFPLPGHALIELEFECSETRCDPATAREHCRLVFKALTVSD